MTCTLVVRKMNSQPASATNAGTGYSQMRYGRGISGLTRRSRMTPAIWPMNCTRMRVAIRASMTTASENMQAAIAIRPSTTTETVGKPAVGCSRANGAKK